MPLPKDDDTRQQCTYCRSERLSRSHTRWHQRPRRWITGQVPYRCSQCGARVWGARSHAAAYSSARHYRSRRRQPTLGVAVAVATTATIAALIAVPVLYNREGSSATTTPSASTRADRALPATSGTQPSTLVALVSSRAYLDPYSTSWNIEGEMRNLGKEPLNNLHVVSTWFDARGRAVASHTDLVDLMTVGPGQTSTFRAATPVRAEMVTFRLEFRSDLGTLLLTQDGSLPPERAVATAGTTTR